MSHAEESHESVSTGHGKDQQPGRWPVHLMKAIWLACMIIVVVTKCSSDDKPKKDAPDYNPGAIYDQNYTDYSGMREMKLEVGKWTTIRVPRGYTFRPYKPSPQKAFLRKNCDGTIDKLGFQTIKGPDCTEIEFSAVDEEVIVPYEFIRKTRS